MKAQSKKMSGKKLYQEHGHAIDFVAKFLETDAQKLAKQLSRSSNKH